MKFKATRRDIKSYYGNKIINIGYCQAPTLLSYEEPTSYCAGINGWDCDNYEINGVLVSTGYRTIKGKSNYKTVQKYEQLAQKHSTGNSFLDAEAHKMAVKQLLSSMISEMMQANV